MTSPRANATPAAALGAAAAAALLLAGCGPKGMSDTAPSKGAACSSAGLPRSARLPRDGKCRVLEAAFTKTVAAVTWGDSDLTTGGGTVVVDRSTPELRSVTISYATEEKPWDLYRVADVTGDGLDDVVLRGADYSDEDAAPYRIVTRRADGFGDTGVYLLTRPTWKGDGTLTAEHPTSRGREAHTWKFAGHRWVRVAPAETKVGGLTLAASSATSTDPADRAADGDLATAWCENKPGDGAGETLTLTLPRKITVARISFATGWDAVTRGGDDRWREHNQIVGASILLDGEVRKRIIVDRGARWVDYIPHDVHETATVGIRLENIDKGKTAGELSCINEVEVYAR